MDIELELLRIRRADEHSDLWVSVRRTAACAPPNGQDDPTLGSAAESRAGKLFLPRRRPNENACRSFRDVRGPDYG